MENDGGLELPYKDSLRQRIPPTIVIVGAVVGDLLSNLTADAAEDEQQPKPRGP